MQIYLPALASRKPVVASKSDKVCSICFRFSVKKIFLFWSGPSWKFRSRKFMINSSSSYYTTTVLLITKKIIINRFVFLYCCAFFIEFDGVLIFLVCRYILTNGKTDTLFYSA